MHVQADRFGPDHRTVCGAFADHKLSVREQVRFLGRDVLNLEQEQDLLQRCVALQVYDIGLVHGRQTAHPVEQHVSLRRLDV